jgi:dihydroneopterin aldolase
MNFALPLSAQVDAPGAAQVARLHVFVRELRIEAEIGVYGHEYGRKQPLLIDVELEILPGPIEHISDTLNYEEVVARAQAIADAGHVMLIETFAERLARACLEDSRVMQARVRVEKPEALAPKAAAAGVEIILNRG